MKFKKIEKKNLDILISERTGQIYEKIMLNKKMRKIKEKTEKLEEILEGYLRESTESGFETYCRCEEARSEYEGELLKQYYTNGLKDGINLIIKNLDK